MGVIQIVAFGSPLRGVRGNKSDNLNYTIT